MEVVRSGFMPPWLPDGDGPRFHGERGLQGEEIETLDTWLANDAPLGDGPEPELPPFARWPLGEPDQVLEVDGFVDIPAEGSGVLHTVVMPLAIEKPKHLVAVQFSPSTPRALHGAGWLFDLTGYGLRTDSRSVGTGYRDMGGVGMNTIGALGGWSPGREAIRLPQSYGFPLEGEGALVTQLHFNGTGKPERERSRVGLYFDDRENLTPVMDLIMGSLCVDIAPGDANYIVTDEITLPVATELIGLYPKARFVCSRLQVSALTTDGDSLPLLKISDYDFNWLEPFWCIEPRPLPAGTRVRMEFVYDNSSTNLRNPHHPPRRIQLGRDAEDEMAFLMLYLAAGTPGDLEALESLHRRGFQERIRDRAEWRESR